jgi:predicted DNA-binding transcriptional regulator AlpA
MDQARDEYLTSAQVCQRYGSVSRMWIFRKTRDEGFPLPATRFGGRKRFWRLSALVAWERSMIVGELKHE